VEAHPAGDADPQGSDLARERGVHAHPAAGMAGARAGGDPGRGAGVGHGALQGLHEGADPEGGERTRGRGGGRRRACAGARGRELHDRVGHELAGPVVGDVATPLHAHHLDAACGEQRRHRQHVRLARIAPQGENGVVLEEEQLVLVQGPVGARGSERLLRGPRVAVRDSAQPAGVQAPGRRRLLLHRLALHPLTIPAPAARAVRGPRPIALPAALARGAGSPHTTSIGASRSMAARGLGSFQDGFSHAPEGTDHGARLPPPGLHRRSTALLPVRRHRTRTRAAFPLSGGRVRFAPVTRITVDRISGSGPGSPARG
jgi:hypothetical protein